MTSAGKTINVILAVLLTVAVGYADYITGDEISFSMFYFIPILFVTWFGSRFLGVAISVLSAWVWAAAELSLGHHYPSSIIPVWNTSMRLVMFIFMAHLVSRLKEEIDAKKGFSGHKDSFTYDISQKPRTGKGNIVNFTLALISVIILGFTDYITGYEISFSIFYFIPILLITWFESPRQGAVISLVSAVAWGISDVGSGHHYSNLFIPFWNAGMRLIIFMMIVYFVGRLKDELSERKVYPGEDVIRPKGYDYFTLAAVLVVILGFTDYITGYEIAFSIFYFIPVLLATWFGSRGQGMVISILSALAWGVSDMASGHRYSNVIIPVWNTAMRLIMFACTAYLASRLREALSAERELSRRKSAFVANVSHELKNPLAIIRMSLDLILDGSTEVEINTQQKNVLEMCRESAERLLRLVKDLLDLSYIESGRMPLRKKELNIGLLLNNILVTYQNEISRNQITLKTDIRKDAGPVWGDEDKLTEVIINLLNNAIKYAPVGIVTVSLAGTEDDVRFEIADTGPGIPKEYLEKIFDKFERIHLEKQEGTGLGLSIAKDIVELHNGKIWAESEPGKGSKFIFVLPRKH